MGNKKVIDSIGRELEVPETPKKIVSLVPSISALVYELGGSSRLVGRTKFCDYPEEIKTIPKVGGTKQFRIDDLLALKPDLVIANKEENTKPYIDAIQEKVPVYVTEVKDWNNSLEMIDTIGKLTDLETASCRLIDQLRNRATEYLLEIGDSTPKVAYLIWKDPYMTVGGDTFIHSMLEIAGFENVFIDWTRYPAVEPDEIKKRNTEYILLSSEPYPFKEKHVEEIQQLTGAKALLVDGALFSWYGSRMLHAFDHFRSIRNTIDN